MCKAPSSLVHLSFTRPFYTAVMDGIEATKKIRRMGIDQFTLPIVGLTASFQRSELNSYLDIGMNDCLGKPIKHISLQRALAAVINSIGSGPEH